MPRGGTTQTRTFNYIPNGTHSPGPFLLSATNPENGTVTYAYNSNNTLASKTDFTGSVFTYQYDSYNRITSISANGSVLRTFYYDANPLNSSFSQYAAGRLAAVGYNGISPQFADMYSYVPAGGVATKRLQLTETLGYTFAGNHSTTPSTLTFDASYAYDSEGRVASITYPTTYPLNNSGSGVQPTAGPSYSYTYDTLGRPSGMTSGGNSLVTGLQYNAANQMTSMTYFGALETRTYNAMLQLTNIANNQGLSVNYTYSTSQNNGKILSHTDTISGETVVYAYDSLKRLITACTENTIGDTCSTGAGWGTQYSYDGFGNLYAKSTLKGSAPALSVSVDPTTNRVPGSYDANGNLLQNGNNTNSFDAENRLSWTNNGNTMMQYSYDAQNKRIWQSNGQTDANGNLLSQQVNFYGMDGKKLASYQVSVQEPNNVYPFLSNGTLEIDNYFAGRLVGVNGAAFVQDRLGSQWGPSHYYPYGEDRGSPLANDEVKFATYTRDSVSGMDYADQRYYSSTYGRFLTADPGASKAAKPDNPTSWNAFAYVKGDPVNLHDPTGLFDDEGNPGYCDVFPDDPECQDPTPITPPSWGSAPTGPLYTWSIDVGYTPTVNLGGGRNSYDHLFIWIHPTGDSNPADGEVFDCGPTGKCNTRAGCGDTTACVSPNGHYNELTNSAAVDFFSMQLGGTDNVRAAQVLGQLIIDTRAIDLSEASHPYNPAFGSNSNSVVYSELQSVGINVPIFTANLPILGNVGVLNYQVNGQTQLFTGWGQNILP